MQGDGIGQILNQKLSIVSVNIRSLNNCFDSIEHFLSGHAKLGVFACQEIWSKNISRKYKIPGFGCLSATTRGDGRGGGIGFWVNENLSWRELADLDSFKEGVYETKAIEIRFQPDTLWCVLNVYRPPHGDWEEFFQLFNQQVHQISQIYKNFVIVGDFNLDLLKETQVKIRYENLYSTINLKQVIVEPTRITPTSATLIDHILVTPVAQWQAGNFELNLADHLAVAIGIGHRSKTKTKYSNKSINVIDHSDKALTKLKEKLQKLHWEQWYVDNDVNSTSRIMENFNEIINSSIDECCAKTLRVKSQNWINAEVLEKKKELQKIHKKYLRTRREEHFIRYKEQRKVYNKLLRTVKENHNKQQLEKCGTDTRKLWKVINQALDRTKGDSKIKVIRDGQQQLTSDNDKTTAFNDFFVSVTDNITIPIVDFDPLDLITQFDNTFCSFGQITEAEILKLISSLESKTSSGNDKLTNKLLKAIGEVIAKPLAFIFNKILTHGEVPKLWKVAKVKPLFKKGDSTLCTNYRPISLLPVLSKVFEKYIFTRIYNHFKENNLFYENQFGFMEGRSTEDAILTLIHYHQQAKEKNFKCAGILCDLAKAFDTVPHDILLKKLKKYGIQGIELKVIESYLSERRQYTTVNDVESESRRLPDKGVPQGSILGPLLFIIYINDLHLATSLKSILYADDTLLLGKASSQEELQNLFNQEMPKIHKWFCANKLSLSIGKTHCVPLHGITDLNITLGTNKIKTVKSAKYLGLEISTGLKWDIHAKKVIKKARAIAYNIARCKNVFSIETRKILYNALFMSNISYCMLCWFPTLQAGLQHKLFLAQKTAIRAVFGTFRYIHTAPLFKQLHLVKLHDFVWLLKLKFIFRWTEGKLPTSLQNFIARNEGVTRQHGQLKSSTKQGLLADIVATGNAAGLFNPSTVSFKTFKKKKINDIVDTYI